MIVLAQILAGVLLAFTIIAILCAAEIARPREAHFGRAALRPKAGSGRFQLPSTRIAARTFFIGGHHAR